MNIKIKIKHSWCMPINSLWRDILRRLTLFPHTSALYHKLYSNDPHVASNLPCSIAELVCFQRVAYSFMQHVLLRYFHVAILPCDKDSAWTCCVRGERLAWVALVSRKKRSCVIYTQHRRCCEKDSACERQRVTAENATKFSCGRV